MNFIYFKVLDSTNAYAREVDVRPDELTVIYADTQTKGRGQFGRHWHSPPGCNLYATFLFRGQEEPLFYTRGMAEVLQRVLMRCGVRAAIKWPNDLFVRGKKIGGILTEVEGDKVMVGLGLNVNMEGEEKIDQPYTSLYLETKRTYSIDALLLLISEEAKLSKLGITTRF